MKRKSRSKARSPRLPAPDGFLEKLRTCRDPLRTDFADAWIGIEPTFSSAKAVRKWNRMSETPEGEHAYFESKSMLRKLRAVARSIARRYRSRSCDGDPACIFDACELEFDTDPWGVERANLRFTSKAGGGPFEVRFGIDPETFEFSIKPIPLAWLYEPRFVRFLQLFVWDVPHKHGLAPSMAHGGGQFSFGAKTYLRGSLLADDVASRLGHPELATWICDYANPDDRSFRATDRRRQAFRTVIEQYWSGAFHPDAIGDLRVENALFDRGFGPACAPARDRIDPERGPLGDERAVFQTNFAFARSVRWLAQNVEPGYWQSAHPKEDGYRPDQIMRYGEGNLNRIQIAGEWHVKSGKPLDVDRIAELDASLDASMLYDEASWEHRGQMSKTSAEDMVSAALLEAHHAQWLVAHPHVRAADSLAQDQLLADAERTLAKRAPKALAKLHKAARSANLADSRGRVRSDWIEPETMFWAAWHALADGQRAEIAREAIQGFVERVENAASADPRGAGGDPMEPHRHRVHPLLWRALELEPQALALAPGVARELGAWQARRSTYLARRPRWSVTRARPPWKAKLSSR